MYVKILKGKSFGGLVNYANEQQKNANIVSASIGINLSSSQAITDSLILAASQSSRCKKPVAHFVLAFSPKDSHILTNEKLERIVNDYIKRMDYANNQFVAIRHYDKEHPHIHLILCRVNNYGKCTSDSHEMYKNIKVCRYLTMEYGLFIAKGKEAVNEERLRKMDAIRYHVMHCVKESLQVASNWKEFQNELAVLGIHVNFRYNAKSSAIEGVSFTVAKDRTGTKNSLRHDISYSGKQLDASLTLQNVCNKLGNPVAIIHEQARDMYEDARLDWIDSHNGFECKHVDEYFPSFDELFAKQSREAMHDAPEMHGDTTGSAINPIISDIIDSASDVAGAGMGIIYADLHTMTEILFAPYSQSISIGVRDGSSSSLGWGMMISTRKRIGIAMAEDYAGNLRKNRRYG